MYLHITIKLLLSFIVLFIITRILGKTQFIQVTPYDEEATVLTMLYSLLLWGVLIVAIKILGQKSLKMRSSKSLNNIRIIQYFT